MPNLSQMTVIRTEQEHVLNCIYVCVITVGSLSLDHYFKINSNLPLKYSWSNELPKSIGTPKLRFYLVR